MKTRILWNFSIKNRRANKMLQIPFILATGMMFALYYIMSSLSENTYVLTRHATLPRLIDMGVGIIVIFTAVFVIYANRFLTKRRNKEFALYGILGLEKKHISRILFFEQVLNFIEIGILSTIGGYLIGKLMFLGLNSLMQEKQVTLMDYPFSISAAKNTLIFLLILLAIIHVINCARVQISNPIQLLSKQKAGEKEPKLKYGVLILGLIFLGAGYFIALTTDGLLEALLLFFVAAICVMIGTYLLFTSFSIFILKRMKKRKSYFYKKEHFLSTSGMLYRMKANAVGIASICILCTGIIIALGTTFTIYRGIEGAMEGEMVYDYDATDSTHYDLNGDPSQIVAAKEALYQTILKTETDNRKVEDIAVYTDLFVPAFDNESKLESMTLENDMNFSNGYYLIIESLDEYNQAKNKNLELKENEIYMTANVERVKEYQTLTLADKEYQVKPIDELISSTIAIGCFYIIVPEEDMVQMANYYKTYNREVERYEPSKLILMGQWNVNEIDDEYRIKLRETFAASPYRLKEKETAIIEQYELNGGFLFLGIVVGSIFLIGTVLVIYYKQVAEGYEDRDNFQIMKKVGLPETLIRKTAKTQIIWMFLLPIAVAAIHTSVASKILYQLLGMFGIRDIPLYVSSMGIVIGIFAIVYMMVFAVTSRIYYRIVNN
jgi:putative ABC transport system permease protein/bacitracin transport system permease protein